MSKAELGQIVVLTVKIWSNSHLTLVNFPIFRSDFRHLAAFSRQNVTKFLHKSARNFHNVGDNFENCNHEKEQEKNIQIRVEILLNVEGRRDANV